jgi:gamma-F420-2:alpha-L-glutamate ligase
MAKKIGILIQRSFSEKFEPLELVRAFKKAGWITDLLIIEDIYFTYDQDGDHFYHLKHGDLAQYDVLLVREVFFFSKYAINVIEYMKNKGKVVVDNNLSVLRHTMNKLVDGQKIIQAGLPFPKSMYAPNYASYQAILPEIQKEIGFPLLLKHKSAGKGSGIFKMNDRLDLENKLQDFYEAESIKSYYVQEMLDLKADYRILVVADEVIGVMQRIPKAGEFRANFSLGGSVKVAELTDEIRDIASRAAKATEAHFAGVDIVYTKDNKPYVLEVNRTPGFQGFMTAHKKDIPALFVNYIEKLYADNN